MVSAVIPAVAPTRKPSAVTGEKINRCAPGGEAVMLKIAELLNVEPQPLDGEAQEITPARMVAVIDENNCIGCTKCIQACR
ncbi:electron transport complex protein [Escherichia coli]|uniref:Electron transport complex protein n=1 Tax=Escherichia coli TaxID=562 RepID=A0A376RIQ3_ECOLX|nr:electron transport complex protein [Escherichia coli]